MYISSANSFITTARDGSYGIRETPFSYQCRENLPRHRLFIKKTAGHINIRRYPKKNTTNKKIPKSFYHSPEVKALAKRATDELKSAFSESLKKLSLKPVYAWSAKYNIASGKMKKLLNLHGLIKAAAKSAKKLIPIQNRKVTDPGFIKFIKAAEKHVIKNNPYAKAALKEKKRKKKITRADRKYKRKFGRNDSEDYGETASATTGVSSYSSVDRKASETSGLDSTKANRIIGPADVQKSKKP